jgi:hypothetical protein
MSKEVESSDIVSLLLKLKNICNPSSSASTAVIIAQFNKGCGKRWGVWCKGV